MTGMGETEAEVKERMAIVPSKESGIKTQWVFDLHLYHS